MKAYSLEIALQYPPEEVTHLYIHNRGIDKLPKEIIAFKNLVELDLGKNRFKSLPEAFVNLTELRKLNLNSNEFSEFPEVIFKLKKLQHLAIGQNQLAKIPNPIGQLYNLESLQLDRNQLKTLPKTLAKCKGLSSVNLGQNRFSEIPPVLFEFKKLTSLSFYDNKIKEIPEQILEFRYLKEMNFSKNKLSEIPACIGQFKQLTTLSLSDNNLDMLPQKLGNLKELNRLFCANNQLTTLPESLEFCTDIEELNLSKNKISKLPSFISKLPNLKKLDCANNKITTLSSDFSNSKKLKKLLIGRNKFSEFPKEILSFNELHLLDNFNGFKGKKIVDFIRKCHETNISISNRWAFFQVLFLKNEKNFRSLNFSDLTRGSSFKVKKIRDLAHTIIIEKHQIGFMKMPLKKGSIISILGKITLKKAALIKRIESANLVFQKEISEKTTHVVLGDLPNIELKKLHKNVVFISEKMLHEWLLKKESPWLLDSGNEKAIENLSQLLLTNQTENIELALQMMSTGGIPKILLTDILIAFKKTRKESLKRELRKVLQMNVSKEDLSILRYRYSFKDNSVEKQKENILKATEGTDFNGKKLIEALF
ncbi:MAG: hypothetical protein NXI23_02310 [Bacteroidetes bacterium]|jgi:Leucine-rich repeat (LRR) protein|nr:hypothetical protein [Bacteroidota bacterium]